MHEVFIDGVRYVPAVEPAAPVVTPSIGPKFFDYVREELFHGKLTQNNVDGMNLIFDTCVKARLTPFIEKTAYILATVYHETARTMQPIEEYGKGKGKKYGTKWYGRGHVQLTWEDNYIFQENKLKALPDTARPEKWQVHEHPEYALDPQTSAVICVLGIEDGDFSSEQGDSLSKYINNDKKDYLHARVLVNLNDRAMEIAAYAIHFEKALRS